jgi:hypothetical protein
MQLLQRLVAKDELKNTASYFKATRGFILSMLDAWSGRRSANDFWNFVCLFRAKRFSNLFGVKLRHFLNRVLDMGTRWCAGFNSNRLSRLLLGHFEYLFDRELYLFSACTVC